MEAAGCASGGSVDRAMAEQTVDDVFAALTAHGYLPDEGLATAVWVAMKPDAAPPLSGVNGRTPGGSRSG